MSSLAAARSRTAVVGRLSSEIGEAIVVSPAKYQASGFSVLLFMALTGLGRLESAFDKLRQPWQVSVRRQCSRSLTCPCWGTRKQR
jgi:hypothetical protein